MTYRQIAEMVSSIGLPYAYYQFPNNTELQPPFVCFLFDGSNDFAADNTNYQRIRQLVLELYTDNKDFTLEQTVENILNQNGLVYSREETYLDSEKMNMVTFMTEIIITEGE